MHFLCHKFRNDKKYKNLSQILLFIFPLPPGNIRKKKIIPETFYRGQKGDIGLTKSFLDIKSHENINCIKEKYSMYRIKQNRNFRNFK